MTAAVDVLAEDAFDEPLNYDDCAFLCASRPIADVLHLIGHLDPRRLSASGRVDAMVAMRRLACWAAAQQQRQVAFHVQHADELSDPLDKTGKQWAREDVACALAIDPDSARGVLVEAQAMTAQFPATLGLLEEGEISPRHATELVRATAALDPEVAAKVQKRVINRAPRQSVANFKRSLQRAVHALDPRSAQEKHIAQRGERRMWVIPQEDGMASLGAVLPAEDAATIQTATDAYIEQIRRLNPEDPRSKAQLRADALTAFALSYLNGGASSGCGRRPAIDITISLETLLGLNEQPAELDGYGPITATVARRIAADPSGTWRRLITDQAGKLLDYQRTVYKPPKPLDEHVKARDRRCRFPRCKRRARHCDIDHAQDWQRDGITCVTNLECLCKRHHQLKHKTGWRLTGNPEATLTWTSPTGHAYTTGPPLQPTAAPVPADDPPF